MRIGISLLTLVPGEVGGAETSARGLCRGLAEAGTLDEVAFTPPAAPGAGEGLPEVEVPEYRQAHSLRERALAMAAARARPGRLRKRFGQLDAVHYPLTIALPRLDAPTAVTVHDLQHLDHPDLFSRAERIFRARMHEGSARRADAVIVPSQFVRRRAIELLGLPPERVHAIPWGIDHERFRTGEDEREQFLLYPARPWPHKNHARLLQAFALLRQERPELKLVLTGGRPRGRSGPAGRRRARARLGRRARVALPARGVPRLPEPVRGVRPAAARGDGVRLPGRGVEHSGRGRGVRRRGGALRPERARRTSPPSSRACSTHRSASPTPGSSGPAASPGRRRPAGTRRSTARSRSARRSRARPARRPTPSRAAGRARDRASRSRTRTGLPGSARRA